MKNNFIKKTLVLCLVSMLMLPYSLLASLELGGISYGHAPAVSLVKGISRGAGFFRAVGGVAFETNATGENGISVYDMKYDKSALDGKRLIITIASKEGKNIDVSGDIYDWELAPIANFSDSQYGSAMTLFGELQDANKSREVLDQRGRVINYHPAFENTLVGLRLFQADILIFQENGTDLFKDNGNYILGAGEKDHNVSKNQMRFVEMSEWLYKQKEKGHEYRSYVVGDLNQKVTFSIKDNQLVFTGKPYWWMWKNSDEMDNDLLVIDALRTYREFSEKDPSELTKDEAFIYSIALSIVDSNIKSEEDMKKLSERLSSYDRNPPVKSLEEFSDLVSNKVYELDGINPIIYNMVTKVMHYSALFRHFKQNHPERYKKFLMSLKDVEVLPKVQTPTIQYAPLRSRNR